MRFNKGKQLFGRFLRSLLYSTVLVGTAGYFSIVLMHGNAIKDVRETNRDNVAEYNEAKQDFNDTWTALNLNYRRQIRVHNTKIRDAFDDRVATVRRHNEQARFLNEFNGCIIDRMAQNCHPNLAVFHDAIEMLKDPESGLEDMVIAAEQLSLIFGSKSSGKQQGQPSLAKMFLIYEAGTHHMIDFLPEPEKQGETIPLHDYTKYEFEGEIPELLTLPLDAPEWAMQQLPVYWPVAALGYYLFFILNLFIAEALENRKRWRDGFDVEVGTMFWAFPADMIALVMGLLMLPVTTIVGLWKLVIKPILKVVKWLLTHNWFQRVEQLLEEEADAAYESQQRHDFVEQQLAGVVLDADLRMAAEQLMQVKYDLSRSNGEVPHQERSDLQIEIHNAFSEIRQQQAARAKQKQRTIHEQVTGVQLLIASIRETTVETSAEALREEIVEAGEDAGVELPA